ncbi:ATP-binding protein [Novispirillum sp. DQ9]|uniref:ATP-binding protein n=1 Tax=Novispirillum sp. DQ9 TaxID=3398612 RepID=UPI003C79EF59
MPSRPPAPPQRLDLPAELPRVAEVQALVEAACEAADMPPGKTFKLSMAVEELLTNVVTHGAARAGDRPVRMSATVGRAGDALVVELSDDAPAFDPFKDAKAAALDASIDDRPIGGLGVHLVRTMVDEVTYAHRDGRNVVTLAMVV